MSRYAQIGRAEMVSIFASLTLLGCPAPPSPPQAVVVVIPTASPSAKAAAAADAEPSPCPPGMAHIAGGVARFGQVKAPIADYCMDIYEVTAAEYEGCVARGECDETGLTCDEAWTYKKPNLGRHPINCVSWAQADTYCRAKGSRLPTFEEWEWAAQGRSEERRFAWGDEEPDKDRLCWSKVNVRKGTCQVGEITQSKSAQGVYDMFGNVWEWLSPAERNGIPNVSRGASWNNDTIDTLEGDNAGGFTQGFERNDVVGFRCVADAAPIAR